MAKTINELKAQSAEIKNATVVGENTATRVGTLFNDIVEHIEQVTADGSTTTQKLAPLAVSTEKLADGAVSTEKLADGVKQAIIYDVSAHNNGAVFESLQALLSSSNLDTFIPVSFRHGGMTIRFIQGSEQSSDNKYVQYFLTKNEWSVVESDWEKQERMVTLNITTLMHLCRLFGAEMKARRSGRILNIASCAAFSAGPYMSVYYASKAFVLSFSQAIDEELREYGVTVTALCLGPTSTHFTEAAEMHGSTMFKKIKPDTPEAVAKTGYRAVMQGRCVKFHGVPTKMMSVAVRFSPRILSRRFAKNINAKPPASFSGKTEGK